MCDMEVVAGRLITPGCSIITQPNEDIAQLEVRHSLADNLQRSSRKELAWEGRPSQCREGGSSGARVRQEEVACSLGPKQSLTSER